MLLTVISMGVTLMHDGHPELWDTHYDICTNSTVVVERKERPAGIYAVLALCYAYILIVAGVRACQYASTKSKRSAAMHGHTAWKIDQFEHHPGQYTYRHVNTWYSPWFTRVSGWKNAWRALRGKPLLTHSFGYIGELDDDGRPHGRGRWHDTQRGGETLDGCWEHGYPVVRARVIQPRSDFSCVHGSAQTSMRYFPPYCLTLRCTVAPRATPIIATPIISTLKQCVLV